MPPPMLHTAARFSKQSFAVLPEPSRFSTLKVAVLAAFKPSLRFQSRIEGVTVRARIVPSICFLSADCRGLGRLGSGRKAVSEVARPLVSRYPARLGTRAGPDSVLCIATRIMIASGPQAPAGSLAGRCKSSRARPSESSSRRPGTRRNAEPGGRARERLRRPGIRVRRVTAESESGHGHGGATPRQGQGGVEGETLSRAGTVPSESLS